MQLEQWQAALVPSIAESKKQLPQFQPAMPGKTTSSRIAILAGISLNPIAPLHAAAF